MQRTNLQLSLVTIKDDADDGALGDAANSTASKRDTAKDMVSALNRNLRKIHANQKIHSSRCCPLTVIIAVDVVTGFSGV